MKSVHWWACWQVDLSRSYLVTVVEIGALLLRIIRAKHVSMEMLPVAAEACFRLVLYCWTRRIVLIRWHL